MVAPQFERQGNVWVRFFTPQPLVSIASMNMRSCAARRRQLVQQRRVRFRTARGRDRLHHLGLGSWVMPIGDHHTCNVADGKEAALSA